MGSVPLIWVVLLSIVIPPVGLILLWFRQGAGFWRKALGSIPIVALGVGHLVLFWGLRVQVYGAGIPSLYFFKPESHIQALEESRRKQAALPAAPEPAPVAAPTGPAASSPAPAAPAGTATPDVVVGARAYWTDFRGPKRDGVYDEIAVRTDWPKEGLPLLWRQPVGGGYASFVVAQNRAFTIEQRRGHEVVAAYDVATGREMWTNSWDALFQESMGGDGPRATPAWNEGKIYALGAKGELRCLDAQNGKVLWSRNILTDNQADNIQWGMAISPLVVDDKVVVQPGGSPNKSVVAYNKVTGEPVWKVLNDRAAYTSPMLVTLAGQRQIVTATADRIVGLKVEDGSLLWDYPWKTDYDVNSAQPVVVDANKLLVSAGYGHGSVLLEISAGDRGLKAQRVWENKNLKARFNGLVLHEGHVYGLDEGILVCVDALTGNRKWKGGRYGYGQILLASGHLIVLTEDGDLALVKASPESHQEVTRFEAIPGKTWNNPAISGGTLFVRNTTEMAAYKLAR